MHCALTVVAVESFAAHFAKFACLAVNPNTSSKTNVRLSPLVDMMCPVSLVEGNTSRFKSFLSFCKH